MNFRKSSVCSSISASFTTSLPHYERNRRKHPMNMDGDHALVPTEPNSSDETVWLPEVAPSGIGNLALTDEERSALAEPAAFADWDVRPDGMPYIEHTWYRDRLCRVLGFGSFTIKTARTWQEGETLFVSCSLYVRNVLVADSIGAARYQPKNPRMDFSDCFKTAKSLAFVRCCADAGLGTGPWLRREREVFLREYCIRVITPEGLRWLRKDQPPFDNERPLIRPPITKS
jgi:hypothetical protein